MVQAIAIYTKNNCPACKMTKKLMDSLGVEYSCFDVTNNEQQLNMLKSIGCKQLPVIDIDGEVVWSGFKPDKIKELVRSEL